MIRIILFAVVLFFFSTNGCAGYIGFPYDREEMYQWCVTIDPDQLESELTELSDEEREIRIGEETDFDQVQFISCILSLQAFVKGVEIASKKNDLSHPKLCDETDLSIGAFLLEGAKGLDSFEEIAWEYLYGRCSK